MLCAPLPPAADPEARRSLRARLRAGPLARAIAKVDVRLYRLLREARHLPDPADERFFGSFRITAPAAPATTPATSPAAD
ncbi:MAG: hypothetical protein KY463_10380 [Actinobacteria bacterium]|nr:hypothetical protein [Actinomycetota bacterium]